MVDEKDYMEVFNMASEAISEVERLQKQASLSDESLEKTSHTLVDCGVIRSDQREMFVKTAKANPSTLLNCLEFMAKQAHKSSTDQPTGVGTVVKVDKVGGSVPEHDRAFLQLYGRR